MNAKAGQLPVGFYLNSNYVLMIVDILLYAEWKSSEIYVLLPI